MRKAAMAERRRVGNAELESDPVHIRKKRKHDANHEQRPGNDAASCKTCCGERHNWMRQERGHLHRLFVRQPKRELARTSSYTHSTMRTATIAALQIGSQAAGTAATLDRILSYANAIRDA